MEILLFFVIISAIAGIMPRRVVPFLYPPDPDHSAFAQATRTTILLNRRKRVYDLLIQAARDDKRGELSYKIAQAKYLISEIDQSLHGCLPSFKPYEQHGIAMY